MQFKLARCETNISNLKGIGLSMHIVIQNLSFCLLNQLFSKYSACKTTSIAVGAYPGFLRHEVNKSIAFLP